MCCVLWHPSIEEQSLNRRKYSFLKIEGKLRGRIDLFVISFLSKVITSDVNL
jgi:hypothetical protein